MRLRNPSSVSLSQESILDFLSSTGLPLVSRIGVILRGLALSLAVASLVYGVFAWIRWEDGFWSPRLPWSGAVPSLAALPFYAIAWRLAEARRLQSSALAMFTALFTLSALVSWPHGAFHPGWYVQPVLALLATTCLGIVPGLLLTVGAVLVLLTAPFGSEFSGGAHESVWVHTTSLAAVILASALTGALVHKLLHAALELAEVERLRERESARALRQREKLLRHAMRVDTVGDLAGLVTHQLRNAFQVMLGHVTLGTGEAAEESAMRLSMVGEALNHARPLLDQLMSLAHPADGAPEPCDLARYAEQFANKAVRVLPSTIAVEFAASAEPLTVMVDPRGLEHSMWNLVINARHAMGDSGTLRISVGRDREQAFVAVADSGGGMPPEVQERVFDPYFTTKPPGQGTGLGLAAVERFVRGSDGDVRLRSAPGKGTTFWLRFPLVASPAQTSAS